MRIPISTPEPGANDEGLMFDAERAAAEGLFEEVTLTNTTRGERIQIDLTREQAAALLDIFFDISANLEPGTEVTLTTEITYVYDYGRVDTPQTTGIGF